MACCADSRRQCMKVEWKTAQDAERLRELTHDTANAKQRDRYRVVLIAGEGLAEQPELQRDQIASSVGRSRQFVDEWIGRYRKGGIEALVPKHQPGARSKLSKDELGELSAML